MPRAPDGARLLIQLSHTVRQSYLTQLWNEQASSRTKGGPAGSPGHGHLVHLDHCRHCPRYPGIYWLSVDASRAMHAFTSVLIIACPAPWPWPSLPDGERSASWATMAPMSEVLGDPNPLPGRTCWCWTRPAPSRMHDQSEIHWAGTPSNQATRGGCRGHMPAEHSPAEPGLVRDIWAVVRRVPYRCTA